MIKTPSGGKRLPWTTPGLHRIEAGSAEALKKGLGGDGGAPSADKS